MVRMTLIGLYSNYPDLFSQLSLPEGINEETCINNIVIRCGESPLLYSNYEFNKFAIGVWSQKWYDSFYKLMQLWAEDYNPLYNYDRYENWKDVNNKSNARIANESIENDITTKQTEDNDKIATSATMGSGSNEHKVSAFNDSTYQPSSIDESSNSTSVTETEGIDVETDIKTDNDTSRTLNDSAVEAVNNDRTGRAYGNIGVTTSQQMFLQEVDLRKDHNIYDVIAEVFWNEFCVPVY